MVYLFLNLSFHHEYTGGYFLLLVTGYWLLEVS